jgi:SAM-dependent methyltransferase
MQRHTAYAEEALRIVAPAVDARVLDVGAGSGALACAAARRVARVTAVDFSPAMLEQLRAYAAGQGLGNVETAVMDAQSLALPDGSFDAAFSLFAFMFVPDRARAFGELRRVLRDGGRVLVATWGPIERRPLLKVGFDAMAEVLPQLPAPQKGDLQRPDECVTEMTAAGFRDVQCVPFTASIHVASPADYLRMLVNTGAPLVALRKRLGEEAWPGVWQGLLDAVGRRIPDGGAELSAEAMLTSGTR